MGERLCALASAGNTTLLLNSQDRRKKKSDSHARAVVIPFVLQYYTLNAKWLFSMSFILLSDRMFLILFNGDQMKENIGNFACVVNELIEFK